MLSKCGISQLVVPHSSLKDIIDFLDLVASDLAIFVFDPENSTVAWGEQMHVSDMIEHTLWPPFAVDLKADAMTWITAEHLHQVLLLNDSVLGNLL